MQGSAKAISRVLLATQLVLFVAHASLIEAAGPRKQSPPLCSRYTIPEAVLEKPLVFAGEPIPLHRTDVRRRIQYEINFLLMDARSVLTSWLMESTRFAWMFREIFAKEGMPQDFALLAPVISSLDPRSSNRVRGAGWWALNTKCDSAEGIRMSIDHWHDDRLDLDLSTRCFAARLKGIRKELKTQSWITATAAYLSSPKELAERFQNWNTRSYWDLRLPDTAESLISRWIALSIINNNRAAFGLDVKEAVPLAFDQVSGLVLAKDLAVADVAKMTDTPARVILQLNPKILPSKGLFPAKGKRTRLTHTLAVPRGKGNVLVQKLKQNGYLAPLR